MIFNFGPQHPSTHGVLSLICMLYGEMMQWMVPEMGLLHRGTEKLIDLHYYNSSMSYFDRFDYVSTITQELLFVHTLESFMNWYISIYDSMLRNLFIEFYSILNHSLAITTHAIDIGLFTSMLWSFEESEKLINYSEVITGNSFHAAFLLMGSLRYDISLSWIESFIYWMMHWVRKLKEIHYILSLNSLWINSLYDMGFMDSDFCFYFGLSGLLSRSTKIWCDASLLGYECYLLFDYYMFLGSNSDCLDRYLLRFNEMIDSCRMIYGIIFIINSYYYMLINYYSICSYSMMEWLIYTFLITFPFILSSYSSLKLSIESSKGIYSMLLNYFPYFLIYIITNDYLTLNCINKFCSYINLGDLIAMLGSIDFVLGSMDY